ESHEKKEQRQDAGAQARAQRDVEELRGDRRPVQRHEYSHYQVTEHDRWQERYCQEGYHHCGFRNKTTPSGNSFTRMIPRSRPKAAKSCGRVKFPTTQFEV